MEVQIFKPSCIYSRGSGLTLATLLMEKEIPLCSRGKESLKQLRDVKVPTGNTLRDSGGSKLGSMPGDGGAGVGCDK